MEAFRPAFHYAPPRGWMNDPCGLVHAHGRYHLYYQHFPGATFWGPMHWGHATSVDLVRWRDEPVALAPDPALGMAFTGSAVLDHRAQPPRLSALLTHHGGRLGGEKQSLATSEDGQRWQVAPESPVIPATGERPFRDPRVFWHAPSGAFVMVLAAGRGVALYRSPDLRRWTRSDHLPLPWDEEDDGLWEVPELFAAPVEGAPGERAWVLVVGRNRLQLAPSAMWYWTGDFDGHRFEPHEAAPRRVDHGPDFYAAQRFSHAPGDAPLWLAWMGNWQYSLVTPTRGWRGIMSAPRRLSLRREAGGLRLVQRPAAELMAGFGPPQALEGARATSFALRVEARLRPGGALSLGLRVGAGEETVLRVEEHRLSLDRRRAGASDFHPAFASIHEAPRRGERVDLLVLVDRSSVEVFAEDGALALSARVFPSPASEGLWLRGEAQVTRAELYPWLAGSRSEA